MRRLVKLFNIIHTFVRFVRGEPLRFSKGIKVSQQSGTDAVALCPFSCHTKSMKNIHLEHPEDAILTGDLSVLDWFTAKSKLSVKMDGAPAIVWGKDPATQTFFVGTKSVFNKVKIKINHSHEEIDKHHTGKVADILHTCFDCLPRINGVIQGDFIGFGGDDTYHPNTITYKFDEIVQEDVIIAPHTGYLAESDLRDAIAFPITKKQQSTDNVLFVQPEVTISQHLDDIEDMCNFARQMSTICEFVTPNEAKKVKKCLNTFIRTGTNVSAYMMEEDIAIAADCDVNLIRLWLLVKSIKDDMFAFIDPPDDEIECYINDELCDHEGYVMHNKFGSYKIVNREVFSYYNFTLAKQW